MTSATFENEEIKSEIDSPVSEAAPVTPLQPVPPQNRVDVIDSLRGLAIFGILLVNMTYFAWPIFRNFGFVIEGQTMPDRIIEAMVRFLAEGKFYIIFSFLFGLGMAIQKERCDASGRKFGFFFFRRMFFLGLIGIAHGALIWSGDILMNYAFLGVILLLFRNCQPKGLMIWGISFFSVSLLFILSGVLYMMSLEPAELARQVSDDAANTASLFQQSFAVYSSQSYSAMVGQRLSELGFMMSALPFTLWGILTSFLMGAWSWRMGLFKQPERFKTLFKRVLIVGGSVGMVGSLIWSIARGLHAQGLEFITAVLGFQFGQFGMGYAYIAGVVLLFNAGKLKGVFKALAWVGRMALTNYLMHSIVFTVIFYNHGIGLMGKVDAGLGLLLTIAMFLIQIPLSRWWLSRFRFGPAEWFWRSLTYMRLQPLRRVQVQSEA